MSVHYPSSKTFTSSSTRPSSPTLPSSKTWRNTIINERISCWGDSLTAGTGGTVSYPSALAYQVPGNPTRTIYQGGVGGETSAQILARVEDEVSNSGDIAVFWAGRNDFTLDSGAGPTVLSNIAAMVNSMTSAPKQYIVLGVLNRSTEPIGDTTGDAIIAFNLSLAAAYPDNYLDIRTYLMTQGDGSSTDNTDVTNGVVPSSLRADNLHLNNAGYQKVAEQVAASLRTKTW